MPAPITVFDDGHYAATPWRKACRALQLGPKYYLWDLPRYFAHRRHRKLSLWDPGVLTNPLREFRPRGVTPDQLPPAYQEALATMAAEEIKLTIPRERLENLVRVWWLAREARGDAIECGSYQGATALLLALLGKLHDLPQRVLMLDTFAGMPPVSAFDLSRSSGEFQPPANQVEMIQGRASRLGVADRVEIHQGFFASTFAKFADRELRFAFAHIDANIYQGTLEACQFVIPRLSPGGAVVFDDYNGVCDLGARLAIDEYLAARGVKPLPLTASSAYLRG